MKIYAAYLALVLLCFTRSYSQEINGYPVVESIDVETYNDGEISKVWLKMIDDGLSAPVSVPVLLAKGVNKGPVLGITAAIHGNELNGIPIIQDFFDRLDLTQMTGTIIAIPGLNPISINQDKRRYVDDEDINRHFPGKKSGNRSQQYAYQITQKILPLFDYHIDLHTASFGRTNSLYVRADMSDSILAKLALIQDTDIVLESAGAPSTGDASSSSRTMRAQATLMGIPSLTIEYGNPQVYQEDMINRGVESMINTARHLKMIEGDSSHKINTAVVCERSFWIYVDQGGLLTIPVDLNQIVAKGDLIGVLKNPFGDILKEYFAPERGIVIGKSSNPVNMNGGRIIHLGIIKDM